MKLSIFISWTVLAGLLLGGCASDWYENQRRAFARSIYDGCMAHPHLYGVNEWTRFKKEGKSDHEYCMTQYRDRYNNYAYGSATTPGFYPVIIMNR